MRILTLRVLDRGVRVRCADQTHSLLAAAYGSMHGNAGQPDLDYSVGRRGAPATFFIERRGRPPLAAPDAGAFLAQFDEDMSIEIQKLRCDLYVVHAAVVRYGDAAVMLVAKSGGGKSTVCWALLHHGFRYLSDELGPVDLETLDVHPYPRALTLKKDPPPSYRLAATTVRTSRGAHVSARDMPGHAGNGPVPLAAVFFLHYQPDAPAPALRPLGAAEAAARLYANALNPLAHAGNGLDAAIRIATARPSFELTTGELGATCALVTATLQRLSER